ncbi:MAG: site-specific integrase [Actinomycetota bacterium]|nr:site-specific integrase [Actinomycetota bacterium]
MPRPPGVQITRDRRKEGSVTFALRVRIAGTDERVPLGNTNDGWDEVRAEHARRQLLAKIELGQWAPRREATTRDRDDEPTFRELATDWLDARKRNPAIRPRTTELNETQLKRYLAPFFGELRPSEITIAKIKQYREQIHRENAQIRDAAKAGRPLRDPRNRLRLRTLSNDSINKTLRTLALILDDAEDAGWIERNLARGRRTREPLERRHNRGALDVDELLELLEAADQLDNRHRPRTLERASQVRLLRDEARLDWKRIGAHVGVAPTTAMYLYECHGNADRPTCGPRRAIIATLALAGPRVGELCQLDNQDISLAKARFHIRDAKTEAGIRSVDIHPSLLDELTAYRASRPTAAMDAPAFPTRAGTRRDRNNILSRVVKPVLTRANELRTARDEPPIRVHVTPHTLRRTYITFMVAAGYDLPYIQAQVGHTNPTTTLAIYAQLMRRNDREQLRTEIRNLLGVETERATEALRSSPRVGPQQPRAARVRAAAEKAGKGRALRL